MRAHDCTGKKPRSRYAMCCNCCGKKDVKLFPIYKMARLMGRFCDRCYRTQTKHLRPLEDFL